MKNTLAVFSCMALSVGVSYGAVSVTNVSQGSDRTVTVNYALDREQIVTFGVETKTDDGAWVRLPGEKLKHLSGDCALFNTNSTGTIKWSPDFVGFDAAFAAGTIRFVVNAYEKDNPPDYLVVDLAEKVSAANQRFRFYEKAEDLPGGLLGNEDYRTRLLVLRRIRAKGIPWVMGSSAFETGRVEGNEMAHQVILDHDYYIGVFPLTQAQTEIIDRRRYRGDYLNFATKSALRIRDRIFYMGDWLPKARGASYPDVPSDSSVLGHLRAICKNAAEAEMLAFDLPSEAEWEFACRAGTTDGFWNDGSYIDRMWAKNTAVSETLPGRYLAGKDLTTIWNNRATIDPEDGGTPIAGSYPPNGFGLYDMHGGVWEYCLDTYADDITQLNGAVRTGDDNFTRRGGSWCEGACNCRSARRVSAGASYTGDHQENGMRVAAPITINF